MASGAPSAATLGSMSRRPPPHLDLSCARSVLQSLAIDPLGLREIGEGTWSRAFGFGPATDRRVIRLGTTTEDFTKDAQAAALYRTLLAVPAIHAVGWWGDVAYAIADEVVGTPLEDLDEAGWLSVLPELWRTIDVIAAAPRPTIGGYGEWGPEGLGTWPSWSGWLRRAGRDTLEARVGPVAGHLESRPGMAVLVDAALLRLEALAPAGEGRRQVVHGDLVNRNVLAVGDRLTGILDWGCVIDGDPALSVAELELWGPWYPDGLGRVDVRDRWRSHLEGRGGDLTDLDTRMDAAALHLAIGGLCFSVASGADDVTIGRIAVRIDRYLG